jgi:hypothetical protein
MNGQTLDISKFLQFSFYELVYYHIHSDNFPSVSNEAQGWRIGIAIHDGDALTYKILTLSNKIIYRSAVRSAINPAKRNKRISPLGGETASSHLSKKNYFNSRHDLDKLENLDSGSYSLDGDLSTKQ